MTLQDTYEPTSGGIIVHSKSGQRYFITLEGHCSCKGYTYRNTCRHADHVKQSGILNVLTQPKPSPKPVNYLWINMMVKRLTHSSSKGA